jgi:hypothetical protein
MMVQLEPKHDGDHKIQNNRYQHIPGECILLVINNQWITSTMNMQHFITAMYLHKRTDQHCYLRIVTDRRLFSPSTLIA